jgi:ubiquinone biosynthesis protein
VVGEYDKTIMDELDLLREAANAAQLRRNFTDSPLLYVPEVHFDLTRRNVMVMERIRGVQISDMATLRAQQVDIRMLAENGVKIFFTQMLHHNFFHADMHPGNIFVLTEDPANPRYAAIDFGIIGTLEPRDLEYLAGNFMAFFDRDYRRIAELHIESGWVPPETRVNELESAVRTVCEPIFQKPINEISFGVVLLRLFETARRFRMTVQPQLVLLQKTLLNIEGLGRELYPQLDLWQTARPLLRDWFRERTHPRTLWRESRRHVPEVIESLRTLPPLLRRWAREAQASPRLMGQAPTDLAPLISALESHARRRDRTLVALGVLLAGFAGYLETGDLLCVTAVLVASLYLLLRR